MLKRLSDLEHYLKDNKVHTRLVVAAAKDENVLAAALEARRTGLVDVILTGDSGSIKETAARNNHDLSGIRVHHEEDDRRAAALAVELIRDGRAEILMNGEENYFGASIIMRAVLDRETGIRRGKIMSHMALFELEKYHKLITVTDTVLNVSPGLQAKAAIVSNAVFFMRRLGVEIPRVAALAAIEVVNESMRATIDAALLSKMSQRGQIKNCVIDGPLAFDNAISRESASQKGIVNDVSGNADILLAPDIETANVLYQSFVFFANAQVASIVLGASAPIVLTTKLDAMDTRVKGILLGASSYVPMNY
jgi:phosphate butyryltransferase